MENSTDRLHQFMLDAAVFLHRFGTPSHRLERVMEKVATSQGLRGIFLYTPTALIVSLTPLDGERDETTYLRRIDSGPVDADKLIRFDEVLGNLERGEQSLADAAQQMAVIGASQPLYPWPVAVLACAVSCGLVALLFGGSMVESAAAASIGLVVAFLEYLHGRRKWQRGFLEPLIGFLAAVGSLAIARWITPMNDRLVTLAALIVFLPGLQLTVGLTELAMGHLSAGAARLAGAGSTLLTLIIGVAIGWQIAEPWQTLPIQPLPVPPIWSLWAAVIVAPITFAIVFRARWPLWPVIIAVAVSGYATSRLIGDVWGLEVGTFAGALIVGCGSNLYARLRDRPALVPLTPGMIVLVPGSLGYRSLAAMLERDTVAGVELAFSMLIVAMALVGGILMSSAVISPKRIL
jgi:uncharacterized membrane protein YjjP (DUF1212 family)